MRMCDKCKGTEDNEDINMYGEVIFQRCDGEMIDKRLDLCQDCYFALFKEVTGKDYLHVRMWNQ